MSDLQILHIGTKVRFTGRGENAAGGTVNAACIRHDGITYEVAWWNGEEYKSAWFCPYEIVPSDQYVRKTRIGFQ